MVRNYPIYESKRRKIQNINDITQQGPSISEIKTINTNLSELKPSLTNDNINANSNAST